MTISPDIVRRVGQLLRMLASDHDGEALSAVRALRRTLATAGVDLNDLASIVEKTAVTKAAPPKKHGNSIRWSYGDRVQTSNVLQYGINTFQLNEFDAAFANEVIPVLREKTCRINAWQADRIRVLKNKVNLRKK